MNRPESITKQYIQCIDRHLDDLVYNRADQMLEIEGLAAILCIHPTHLSNTIQQTMGTSACGVFQVKIMERALQLLGQPGLSIKHIALQLSYEPSQFTKSFKRITGLSPKQYRMRAASPHKKEVNSEIMTILKNYADLPLCF